MKRTRYIFLTALAAYGLLNFIVNNDLDVFKQIKHTFRQIKQVLKKDNKITLLKWSFKLNNYKKLKQEQLDKLNRAARHF